MPHYYCDEGPGCDPQIPACTKCDLHPMQPVKSWWECECGHRLLPRAKDPVWPWELIRDAYMGRVWVSLGYESWDEYTSAEFGSARLKLPREERQQAVLSLRDSGLSIRAISSGLGIDKNTVQSDLKVSEIHTPEVHEPVPADP